LRIAILFLPIAQKGLLEFCRFQLEDILHNPHGEVVIKQISNLISRILPALNFPGSRKTQK